MIRYVAIGAVVGFVFAFFLLSRSSEDLTAPPVDVPVVPQMIAPSRPNPSELMRLQPLPPGLSQRAAPIDAGPH